MRPGASRIATRPVRASGTRLRTTAWRSSATGWRGSATSVSPSSGAALHRDTTVRRCRLPTRVREIGETAVDHAFGERRVVAVEHGGRERVAATARAIVAALAESGPV